MIPIDLSLLHDFPDRAIRWQLQQPGNLRDLLGAVVPTLAPHLDCDQAELQSPIFPLDDWRYRESDLLFLIPYRTGKGRQRVLVCVLIEHQSAADPRMPLRVLLYTVLFWEREWKRWEERSVPRPALQLTPVLPIVFQTGPRPWTAPRTLAELVAGPEALRPFVPAYQPLFWDLAEQSPEALLASTAEWLQTLAVIRVDGEDRAEFFRVMGQAVEHLRGLAGHEKVRWHGLLWFLLAWAMHRRPSEEHEALITLCRSAQLDVRLQTEVQTMSETIAQHLEKKGEKKGRQEGQLQALRDTLVRLLRQRFGRLPADLRRQIKAMTDVKRLQACLDQVLRIQSLDELHL